MRFVQFVFPLLEQTKSAAEETVFQAREMCDEAALYSVGCVHVHIIY